MENEALPDVPELRARGVGGIIDAGMKLYFARWRTFIPVAAVFMVPYAAVSAIAGTSVQSQFGSMGFLSRTGAVPTPEEFFAAMAPLAVLGLAALVLYPVLAGALSWAAARAYLGENPPVGTIVGFAFSRFGPLLWVSILTGLLVAAVFVVPLLAWLVVTIAIDAPLLFFLGLMILLVPLAVIFVRLVLGPTALVVENARGVDALRRSWNLVKGSFWKVVGTMLLAGILAGIVQGIITVPFSILSTSLVEESLLLSGIFAFLGQALGGALITPFGLIVQVILYFDLRIRKEGFDLSSMAQPLEQ